MYSVPKIYLSSRKDTQVVRCPASSYLSAWWRKGSGMLLRNRGQGGWHSRSQGHGTSRSLPKLGLVAVAAVVAMVAAGCSSSSSSSTTAPASAAATSSSPASSGSATVPSGLSISSFTVDIASTMSQLKPLATAGTKGASS